MANETSILFEPVKIGGKTLKNRIVMPPMVAGRDVTGEAGQEWYRRHARGGPGLVIVEMLRVPEFGGRYTAENLKPLAAAIHEGGAVAGVQLFLTGPNQTIVPAQHSREDIDKLVDQYRIATEICAEAGFDAIEPHGAHWYPLNAFFCPTMNERKDEYGGSIENRMRLGIRIVETMGSITKKAGMVLMYRHSPVGKGYGVDESVVFAEALVKAGVEVLDISPSSKDAPGDLAAPFMKFGVPVITVYGLSKVERAVEAIREKRATLIAVGRGMIADPEWTNKVKEGRIDEIVPCVECNGCFGYLGRGEPVECANQE